MPLYLFEIGDVDLLDVEGNILITHETWEIEDAELMFKDSYDPEDDPFYDVYDSHDPFDPDPYDPFYGGTNYGWVIVWRDEVPEIIWALDYEDSILIFDFPSLTDEEIFTDYPEVDFGISIEEEFEHTEINKHWTIDDHEEFYNLFGIPFVLVSTDEFTVTFPIYWLETTDYFDFSDVTYYWVEINEFSLSLPIIYFLFPTFEDTMGDVNWSNTVIIFDTFPEYPPISGWVETTIDEMIGDPINRLWSLIDEDDYPELIDNWIQVFYYDVEPEPMTWIANQTDNFNFHEMKKNWYWTINLNETFGDDGFDLIPTTTENFDTPDNWDEIDIDTYGDDVMSLFQEDEFDFKESMPFGVVPTFRHRNKWFSVKYNYTYSTKEWKMVFYDHFQIEPLYPVPRFMVKWEHLVFEEWFDFNNFDCNYYTSCYRIKLSVTDNFEIGSFFDVPFIVSTEDYFEIGTIINEIYWQLVDIDDMSDYTWLTITNDTFDIGKLSKFTNPITTDGFIDYPVLLWDDYFPYDTDLFNSPVAPDAIWLHHITEMFSPDVGYNLYQIFLIDEFDEIYIELREPALITEDGYLIYLNDKLMLDTYKDFGPWGG